MKPLIQILSSLGASALLACAVTADAAEIKVLTAGAFKPVVQAVVPEFEKQTGHRVIVENDTVGGLARRIKGDEAFDVAILSPATITPLVQDGKIATGSVNALARVGVGVAVKRGAAMPNIATVDAFKTTLLAARAVAYIDPAAGGSSGIYFSQLIDKLGIGNAVKAKAVLVPGGLVAERLLTDQADIAIHQISEILAVPGAVLVGPIPAEIQNYTTYSGGLSAKSSNLEAAQAFLAALKSDSTQAILKQRGMEAAK